MPEPPPHRRIERTLFRRGAKYDVELVTASVEGNPPFTRELIRHAGSVIILPIRTTAAGECRVVLIENYRVSIERPLIELPAGTRMQGEDPMLCARRELTEETGYEAMTLTPLCSFLTAPGLTDERMHAFVATDLTGVGQRLEPDEEIRVVDVAAEEAVAMATKGTLDDAKTMLVLLLARARGLL